MKHLHLLIIILIFTSCCSAKKAVQPKIKKITPPEDIRVYEEPKSVDSTKQDNVTKNTSLESKNGNETEVNEDELPQPEHETTLIIFDHSPFTSLLQKYVSDAGKVNYKGLKTDFKALRKYIASLGENRPEDTWVKEEKLAYWINAYNAMTLDLIIRNYPVNSIKDINKPWEQRLWKLGKKWYNLDEIEHQIIRKMEEPRIHFALVCAAESCPKLYNKAFTPDELNDDLTRLTEEFLADPSKNNITEDQLKLSKIFKWFAKDFKKDGSLIDFLNEYSLVNISNSAKKSFKEYNWNLND